MSFRNWTLGLMAWMTIFAAGLGAMRPDFFQVYNSSSPGLLETLLVDAAGICWIAIFLLAVGLPRVTPNPRA